MKTACGIVKKAEVLMSLGFTIYLPLFLAAYQCSFADFRNLDYFKEAFHGGIFQEAAVKNMNLYVLGIAFSNQRDSSMPKLGQRKPKQAVRESRLQSGVHGFLA